MNIAFFEIEEWQRKEVINILRKDNILFFNNSLSKENVNRVRNIEVLVVFIYSKLNKEILEKMPKLKMIATMSTGFDHIDMDYCKKKKIIVANVPTYGENTVAEHTFALILALSRKIYPSIKRTHEGHSFETDNSLRGFDLKERTLGIIGCGHIGEHVARIAKGYEMNTLVYDVNVDRKLEKKIGFKYVNMDFLFKNSDIISLHVPYNKKTHHLVNNKTISKMKNGVYLINTSRGAIVDTHALIKGLKSGKVAGAGLDVLEEESEIKEEASVLKDEYKSNRDLKTILEGHMLMKMDNVLITPHNAFNSKEALTRILETTIENIKEYSRNKRCRNGVYLLY